MTEDKKKVIIAIDLMGGESAPDSVLKAINLFLKSNNNTHFLGYGDENIILPKLKSFPRLENNLEVIHTESVIDDNDKPSSILRSKKASSMSLAIDSIKNGEASAVVSGGNTGALMAYSKFSLKTLPGIDRPAICSLFPTIKNNFVTLLDLGANIDCNSENLIQFAIMGNAFAQVIFNTESPKISLLNVGGEENKGSAIIKSAATELKSNDYNLNFCGYIEGNNIVSGDIDVVVTDGFSGNVLLKASEGTANLCKFFIKNASKSSILAKIGFLLARNSLRRAFDNIDPRLYNGAMFLGINGIVVKSHGSSDYIGFSSAIKLAYNSALNDINEKIIHKISYNNDSNPTPPTTPNPSPSPSPSKNLNPPTKTDDENKTSTKYLDNNVRET